MGGCMGAFMLLFLAKEHGLGVTMPPYNLIYIFININKKGGLLLSDRAKEGGGNL